MSTGISESQGNLLSAIKYAAGTDIGKRREENQDSFGIIENERHRIFLVADGMGGVKGGAEASRLAIKVITDLLREKADIGPTEILSAVATANGAIFEQGGEDPSLSGMGTTLVGAVFIGACMYIINVGDSRLYRTRNGRIRQLSEDHTLVRELLRSGTITIDQAENHPVAHMLTRSLGPTPDVEVDCFLCEDGPARGDIYVLCSDGLYNLVSERDLLEIVSGNSMDEAIQKLIDLANQRGGTDNITIIMIQVGDGFPISPDEFPEDDSAPSVGLEDTVELYVDSSEYQVEPNGHAVDNGAAHTGALSEPRSTDADKPSSPRIEGGVSIEKLAGAGTKPPEEQVHRPDQEEAVDDGVNELERQHSRRHIELFMVVLVALIIGFVVGGWFSTDQQAATVALQTQETSNLPSSDSVQISAPVAEIAEVAPVEVSLASFEVTAPRMGILPPLKALSEEDTLTSFLSDDAHQGYSGLARHEIEHIVTRKRELTDFLAAVDEKLKITEKPISGTLAENLRLWSRQREAMVSKLEEVQQKIDQSARKLSVWYGRQKRLQLQGTDPVNLASEVAVSSPSVKEKWEIFQRATWAYMQEAEVQRFNPADEARDQKVKSLMKMRRDRMIELTDEVKNAIEEEVRAADHHIAELTLERDSVQHKIEAADEELKFAQTILGSDTKAKDAMRQELVRKRQSAQAELDELRDLLPQ